MGECRVVLLARLVRTVRYLRPIQIFGRLWFRLYRPRVDLRPAPPQRFRPETFVSPPAQRQSMCGPARFSFLEETAEIDDAVAWNDPVRSHLWLYHLHYFDDLNAVGADARAGWHQALIARWIAENPPGHGVGWEPYPTSLRIVNWVKWQLRGGVLPDEAIHSLAVQARWLSRRLEYHLLGNHLLANAKALVFAGCFFEGAEARQWQEKGLRILKREVTEQILDDGGHFERSPMYHHLVLEDLLDVMNLLQAYDMSVPGWLVAPLPAMLQWANAMSHPDGEIAFFNDATFGVAPTCDVLADYAEQLGVRVPRRERGSTLLQASGYARLESEIYTALVDVAPVGPDYLPGHAHADTLSLELSVGRQRVLVNSGISLYERGSERSRQRGTAAHNTICIDGVDSSEVWAGFRVGRRARVRDVRFAPMDPAVSAHHDGYCYLSGKPVHRREVRFIGERFEVTDWIEGDGNHRVEGYWHFHPDIVVEPIKNTSHQFHLRVARDGDACVHELTIQGADEADLQMDAAWHPAFGRSVPIARLVFRIVDGLPLHICTTLEPTTHNQDRHVATG